MCENLEDRVAITYNFELPFSLVPIIIGHELTVYTTTEAMGHIELCAVISEPDSSTPQPFTLNITTKDDIAG